MLRQLPQQDSRRPFGQAGVYSLEHISAIAQTILWRFGLFLRPANTHRVYAPPHRAYLQISIAVDWVFPPEVQCAALSGPRPLLHRPTAMKIHISAPWHFPLLRNVTSLYTFRAYVRSNHQQI